MKTNIAVAAAMVGCASARSHKHQQLHAARDVDCGTVTSYVTVTAGHPSSAAPSTIPSTLEPSTTPTPPSATPLVPSSVATPPPPEKTVYVTICTETQSTFGSPSTSPVLSSTPVPSNTPVASAPVSSLLSSFSSALSIFSSAPAPSPSPAPSSSEVPSSSVATSTSEAVSTSEAPSTYAVPSPSSVAPSTSITPTPASTSTQNVPTPVITTFPNTGTFTIPATTITIWDVTTVCGASETPLPSAGTYTIGGITTVVEHDTTVICSAATTLPWTSNGDVTVTSTLVDTTYVCPSAGTYTIAPFTTVVESSTTVYYPVSTTYPAGVYTVPDLTVTVTETDFTTYCPFASSTASSTPAAVVTVPTTSATPTATPSPASSSTASATSSTPAASTGIPSLGSTAGDLWAMTYTPYSPATGQCLDAASVLSDLTVIKGKGFTTIRMYSSSSDDCNGLENIGAAAKSVGLKIVAGVWIGSTGISGAAVQLTDLLAWGNEGNWNLVEGVLVGNEAITSGYTTASALASFITEVRTELTAAGYTGGVSTTEILGTWQSSTSELCSVVDYVGVNLHPFFNADCDAADAGSFVLAELKISDALCEGKTAWNMETGWPSASTSCNGKACGSVENQKAAISAIKAAAGNRVSMFSYADDLWKAAGDFGCEQNWGCINVF